ncbi:MAG: hypothetical protein QOD60_200, partial [Solirubrobacterales bacterium]|nr:hypothetical protein [Solirubrobacterales bacterium]
PWRAVRLAKFAGRHPELAGKATNGTADKVASKVASGQSDKR